jgi:transcriptional regulator with XRE-family HTH domain
MPERTPLLAARLVAIGERVRSARIDAGLSQEQLADAAGLHRTYIGSIERGERNLAVGNLFGLADALQLPVTELVGE